MTVLKIPATFGAWVRTRRKQLDITQAELGKRAGCSEAAVRKIEADERKPSRQLAELLASALEISQPERETFLQFSRGVLVDEIHIELKSHPHNLPTLLTSTVDRTRDLANVTTLLKDKAVHLVTLIGPPGIGKTRLSIHCGNESLDDFPDGVWFVDLAEIQSPEFFLPTLARSLPSLSLSPSPDLPQLLNGLRDRRLLLILDNFEHIVDKSALDVAQILKTCPHLKILVTSRVPLHIYGEHEYALPPLSVPPRDVKKTKESLMEFESVQLFVARTRQHQPAFSITPENTDAIIDICTILDGIPLALELAAATLRQMTLDEMVSLLRGKDWVKQIATPARDLPQRQRTLENVIDWSYTLLDDEQQEFFGKLGVFSGWFDAEAAAAVCEMEAMKFLNALTDHSLLEREFLNGKAHWRMLELIHGYAISKLNPSQLAYIEQRRAGYFSEQLQALRQQEIPQPEREEYYRIHINNLLAGLRWAIKEKQTETGFQLAEFLDDVWGSAGYLKEGLELVRQLMALPDASSPQVRANRLHMASDLAWQLHDFKTSLAYSKTAVELGRTHGLKDTHIWFLNRLGRIYIEQEKYAEAKAVLEECLDLASASPEILNPGSPLAQLGEVAFFEGRLDEAKSLLEKALVTLDAGDGIFLAMTTTDLAEIALEEKDFSQSRHWLGKACEPASQQIRRTLVFLCALAGYLVLSSKNKADIRKAAQVYGAVETLSATSGIHFNSFYQRLNRARMQKGREKLSAGEWQRAYETGLGWERGEAIQQAKKFLGL
jgi:predicted ATPase/transcriptional regulator with XRE-family HTH domain